MHLIDIPFDLIVIQISSYLNCKGVSFSLFYIIYKYIYYIYWYIESRFLSYTCKIIRKEFEIRKYVPLALNLHYSNAYYECNRDEGLRKIINEMGCKVISLNLSRRNEEKLNYNGLEGVDNINFYYSTNLIDISNLGKLRKLNLSRCYKLKDIRYVLRITYIHIFIRIYIQICIHIYIN